MKLYAVIFQSGLWMGVDRKAVEKAAAVAMTFENASREAEMYVGAELVLLGFSI